MHLKQKLCANTLFLKENFIPSKIRKKLKLHHISPYALRAITGTTYYIDTKVGRYQREVDLDNMLEFWAERTLRSVEFTKLVLITSIL